MSPPNVDCFAELRTPAHWQAVEFISDLHLQVGETATFDTWRHYLEQVQQGPVDALFILGDLFEVWVGDDVLRALSTEPGAARPEYRFCRDCVELLHQLTRHKPVYFMHGNRDFLLGTEALAACGMQVLADPTALVFQDQRWLLSHGDALCLDDTEYMQFRAQVRQTSWQSGFLARSLDEREALARLIRGHSDARKKSVPFSPADSRVSAAQWADVDGATARQWLESAEARTLIHGHTHRPGQHDLGDGRQRIVLSDWDAAAHPPRAEVLRLDASGPHRIQVPVVSDGKGCA